MSKIDPKKELKHLYRPSAKKVVVVDVPLMNFLMIGGHGDPNTTQEYEDAAKALYAVAYALKFMSKKEKGMDYVVPPLEALWWVDNMEEFTTEDKSAWEWTMMIMQPEPVTPEMFEGALKQVKKKKNPPALSKIRFESFPEGLSVQIMYVGPYSEEGPTIEKMHDFIEKNGYESRGKHHEIYLSDPRRTAPERLKTVLRQPVNKPK